ncbi:type I restriction modification DNA specificity domain protein [Burkholderiales bacterium 1_1_47]|nr:type I restriction modification DNA specificity domain protein [Burkholderiales bacterium 1_1_47]
MKTYKLTDIAEVIVGGTPKTSVAEYWNGDIPWLSVKDFNKVTRYVLTTEKKISMEGLQKSSTNLLKKDDIIISARGTVGALAMIKTPMAFNQSCYGIRVNAEKVSPAYLFYSLKTKIKALKAASHGSVFDTITLDTLNGLDFELPSLNEQLCASNFLSLLDEKIELNNSINRNLDALARQLYDYWFVQFDFPDESGRPYRTSGGKMVWNNRLKRNIPEHWEVVNIFDSVDVQYGFPFSTDSFVDQDSDVPVVRIRDILNGTVSAYSTEQVGEKYRLSTGDLILGMDGNFHMNLWCDNKSFLNQRCVRFRQKDNSAVSTLQVMYEIAPYIRAKEQVAKGSTVGHLSDKDLKDLWIMTPLNNKYFSASSTLNHISNLIIENRREISELTKLRDDLLPILLNGQVSIRALR